VTTAFARRWRHHGLTGLAAGFVAMVDAACAGSHKTGVFRPEPASCVLAAPTDAPPESITVALPSALGGVVIAQSSEALVGVDCGARPYGKLVQTWPAERMPDGPRWTITLDSNAASRVRVRSIDAATARDALDGGVDLLVTDNPAIVSYAKRDEELLTLPLPWDRTYVVLTSESAPADASATLRLTLADLLVGAVRADFRTAQGPFWWESADQCTEPLRASAGALARASFRVVYLSGDRVAQGVVERLVALAGSRLVRGEDEVGTLLPRLSQARMRAVATALSPSAFAAALQAGDDLAYVLPLPRSAAAPCQEFAMLLRAAPWLQSVIPLLDTRSHAIVRRGRVGLAVDADGSLRLLGASGRDAKP
jgi:hypothetical protein